MNKQRLRQPKIQSAKATMLIPGFVIALLVFAVGQVFSDVTEGRGAANNLIQFAPFTFVSTMGEQIQAEMGWLLVPEQHTNPGAEQIRLPVIRFKSTNANPGFPVVYLSGGPGESGIETAKTNIFPVLIALREYADVIVFDQRGTGRAEPSLSMPGIADLPLDELVDSETSRKRMVAMAREASGDLQKRGIDLSAYNTNESADDVGDLRHALGAEKIVLWGHSYGSHLGLAVLKRHGSYVHRAMLGGVNGPDQRWRYPNDLEELLDRVDARIKAIPKLSRELPSLKEATSSLFAKIDQNPVTVKVQSQSVVIRKKEIQLVIALMSGSTEFVQSLPLFIGQMNQGNFMRAAQLIQRVLKGRNVGTAMRFSMHIASGVSQERAAKIDAQTPTALFGNAINFPFDDKEFVSAWGVSDLGSDYRSLVKTDVPTLFLSGNMDGRTSIADAEEVRKGFSISQHVIIECAGHDFYHLSDRVVAAMLDFLNGKPVGQKIVVPLQLRGPAEQQVIFQIRKVILDEGIEAAVQQLRMLFGPEGEHHLSSFVPGTLAVMLTQQDQRPREAMEVLKIGVELFPDDSFLHERLADLYTGAGLKELALQQYKKCLELNSLNRNAALKIKQLGGG